MNQLFRWSGCGLAAGVPPVVYCWCVKNRSSTDDIEDSPAALKYNICSELPDGWRCKGYCFFCWSCFSPEPTVNRVRVMMWSQRMNGKIFDPSVVIVFDPGCVCLNINTQAETRIINSNYLFPMEIHVIGVKSKGIFSVCQFIVRLKVILSTVNLICFSFLCQGCTQLPQKVSTASTLRGTAIPVLMRPKPATSTEAARGSAPPTSLPAARRTPTRVKPAARSAATKRLGCSWTACPLSSATGCSSAPARVKVVQSDAGRRLCLIAPIKIRRSPTVWSYGRSAARILSAGAGTGNGGGMEGRGWRGGVSSACVWGVAGHTFNLCACMSACMHFVFLARWTDFCAVPPQTSEDS